MRGATVVFDLDGTLVDTAPDLLAAADHVFASIGLKAVPHAVIRPAISFGSRRMIENGLAYAKIELPGDRIDQLWRDFLVYYEHNISAKSRPFPGVTAVMDDIERQGGRLAICTNKFERHAKQLLADLKLADRFSAIAGRDTFRAMKPDPTHLIETIEAAGGDPAHALMIGDSDVDVATAKAANIPVVGVSFGYTHAHISTFTPTLVIDHYDQLRPELAKLLARNPSRGDA
jgi:phosphoglycolate phosphatase